MNFKATGILLALLIVVGGFILWQNSQTPPKNTTVATQITNIKDQDISSFSVSYQGKTVALQRDGKDNWNLTQPEKTAADFLKAETATGFLENLSATSVLTGTVGAPSAYGLDKPVAEASIKTSQGKTDVVMVGDKTPDDSSYYVKRADSPSIYLVSTSTISNVVGIVANPPKATPTPTPSPTSATTPTPAPSPTPGS